MRIVRSTRPDMTLEVARTLTIKQTKTIIGTWILILLGMLFLYCLEGFHFGFSCRTLVPSFRESPIYSYIHNVGKVLFLCE